MGGARGHRRQPHQHGTLAGLTASIRSSVRSSPSWDEQSKTRCLRLEESPLVQRSKYPPAEPEALRLLAPQRGLIATAEKQKQLQRHEAREATGFGKTK